MIVDDEPVNLAMLEAMLDDKGYDMLNSSDCSISDWATRSK